MDSEQNTTEQNTPESRKRTPPIAKARPKQPIHESRERGLNSIATPVTPAPESRERGTTEA